MFEELAREASARTVQRIQAICDGSLQAINDGEVAYAKSTGLEAVFDESELEKIFQSVPAVVLVSAQLQTLEAKDAMSPIAGLTAEAERYFKDTPKYTGVKKYMICGFDNSIKEKVLNSIVSQERDNNAAVIEVKVELDGAHHLFSMMPWKHETHIIVDAEGHLTTRQRRSREQPWE